ncbi:MAG: aminopeptidase P family protein [Chitinispirillaceae bacterium]|nr:aminopeptidase P family protein [Chitinispirillaceae bacterium]
MLIKEKVRQAVRLLQEFEVECWITFTRESSINGDPILPFLIPSHVTWLSAFIISADGRTHAIVGRYDVATIEETGAFDKVTGYLTSFREPFLEYMKKLEPKRIAVNFSAGSEICDGLTHGMYLTLAKLLSEIAMADRLVSAERIVSALRERKSAMEIAAMKKAIAATEEIFAKVASHIRPGMTEQKIAGFMLAEVDRLKLKCAWDRATCPAVFSGPDTAEAHYSPTSRVVMRGQVLNMDFGINIDGYCSDMQRSFYIMQEGEDEPPHAVARAFDDIVTSMEEARKFMRPGVQGISVDAAARTFLTRAGYEEFPHALGHQVGRFAHDGTALLGPAWDKYGQRPYKPLEENMVFAVEPRAAVPDRGTMTVEDMAIVTAGGAQWLSNRQNELLLIR